VKKIIFLLIYLYSFISVNGKDREWGYGVGAGLSLLEYNYIGQSGPVGLRSFTFLPEFFAEFTSGKRVHLFRLSVVKYNKWKYTDSGDPASIGTDMLITDLMWRLKWRLGSNETRAVQFYAGPTVSFFYRNWNNAFEGGITKQYRLISAKGGGYGSIIYSAFPSIDFFVEGVFGGLAGRYKSFSGNELDSSGPEVGVYGEFGLGLDWAISPKFTVSPYYKYGSMNDYNNLYSINFRESIIELKLKYRP
jgi:hypothetical protein